MPYIHSAKRYYLIIVYRGEQFSSQKQEKRPLLAGMRVKTKKAIISLK